MPSNAAAAPADRAPPGPPIASAPRPQPVPRPVRPQPEPRVPSATPLASAIAAATHSQATLDELARAVFAANEEARRATSAAPADEAPAPDAPPAATVEPRTPPHPSETIEALPPKAAPIGPTAIDASTDAPRPVAPMAADVQRNLPIKQPGSAEAASSAAEATIRSPVTTTAGGAETREPAAPSIESRSERASDEAVDREPRSS